jgi:DNA-repair protein XRCC3
MPLSQRTKFRKHLPVLATDLFRSKHSHALSRIAALLREYAHRHEICVVVTNHVVDHVDDSRRNDANPKVNHRNVFGPPGVLTTSGRNVTPALGLFWANCVNSRIFLKRTGGSASGFGGNEGVGGGGVVGGVTRHASVVFSSHLPHGKDVNEGGASVRFEVRKQGVFGVACDG